MAHRLSSISIKSFYAFGNLNADFAMVTLSGVTELNPGLGHQLPPLQLLAHPVVRTTDRDVALDFAEKTISPMRVEFGSSRGLFEFQLCAIEIGRLDLQSIEQKAAGGIVAHLEPAGDLYAIEIPIMGAGLVAHQGEGVQLIPGRCAVITSPEHNSKWIDCGLQYRALRLQLRSSVVEAKFKALMGTDKADTVNFAPHIDFTNPVGRSFIESVSSVFSAVDAGASIYSHPSTALAFEDMLVMALLTGFAHSRSDMLDSPAKETSHRVVELAQEYLMVHSDDPIAIENIAAVASVSVRSLQRTFRRIKDITPIRYLKNVRLDKARLRLSKGGSETSVTQVAMDSGFGHLGAFGADYKLRFGEAPSETLQRSLRHQSLRSPACR